MENAEDEGEGVGEKEEQWLVVEMAEAGGELRELLSIVLYSCSFFFRTVENEEDKGEGEGEEKWLAVETTETGGELLSIVRMQREQWRMQKTKEGEGEGEEKEQWLAMLFTTLFLVFFFRASV